MVAWTFTAANLPIVKISRGVQKRLLMGRSSNPVASMNGTVPSAADLKTTTAAREARPCRPAKRVHDELDTEPSSDPVPKRRRAQRNPNISAASSLNPATADGRTSTSKVEKLNKFAVNRIGASEKPDREAHNTAVSQKEGSIRKALRKKGGSAEFKVEEQKEGEIKPSSARARKHGDAKALNLIRDEVREDSEKTTSNYPEASKKKVKQKKQRTNGTAVASVTPSADQDGEQPKPKRRRKTKEEKAAEAMPIAARTVGSAVLVGAHVSAAGGVHNAVNNAVYIGGNAFALFLKSQRKWENPPLQPTHADEFKKLCVKHVYAPPAHVLPHGSYLVNLAAKDEAKSEKSYAGFLDDLRRCEELGIALYNFHPGNTNGEPRDEAISRLAGRLNAAHAATSNVVTVLENMASKPGGNGIGGRFEDLRDVIALVQDKKRVGVCLDTCHAFAAGYDLRSPAAFAATMTEFENIVGTKYLRGVHLNDSKAPLGSHRDLHQNIGLGFLGLRAFHNLVNDARFTGLPMVLETPIERKNENGKMVEDKRVWAKEIKLLEGLVGMNANGDEFMKMEEELASEGAEERKKYQEQHDRKLLKDEKAKASGRKRKAKPEEEDEESECGSGAESDE